MASTDQNTLVAVNKAVMNVSKAEAVRKETELLMKPYANWEQFLMPGPLTVAMLGELIFISANNDFSINKNPPSGGFKHIKYPESFRACLMQVSNEGWRAFNEAHKNMDQIRLHSHNVPQYVKKVVQTLFQGNIELVQALLPAQLENIKTISEECTSLAKSVEMKFTSVILLVQEMLEASLNAKSIYEKDLEEVKRLLEESKMKEEAAKKAKELSDKQFTMMEKNLKDAQEQYKTAMDSMPSGWEIIGMAFVEGLCNTINSTLAGLASSATKYADNYMGVQKGGSGSSQQQTGSGGQAAFSANDIYAMSSSILKLSEGLSLLFDKDVIQVDKLYDKKRETVNSNWARNQFQNILKRIEREFDCSPKLTASKLCNAGIYICNDLEHLIQKHKTNLANIKNMQETKDELAKIIELKNEAMQFDSQSKAVTNSSAVSPLPPNISKSNETNLQESAVNAARYKVEQSKEQLKNAQEMYDKSFERLERNNKELVEILSVMRRCELKEIDFDMAVKMLVKGLNAMGRLKEQWEKVVRFFQMISNLISSCFSSALNNFVNDTESIKNVKDYNINSFIRDLIYTQAFNASNIANLVNMISSTYSDVSSKFLMDKVSSLGKLITLEPGTPAFNEERAKLGDDCNKASEDIVALVLKNKKEFEKNLQERVNKISSELESVLPPISAEEHKKIKDTVKAGMTITDEDQFF